MIDLHREINRFDVSRGKLLQRPLGTSALRHAGIRHARIHERVNAYVKKLKASRSYLLFLSSPFHVNGRVRGERDTMQLTEQIARS